MMKNTINNWISMNDTSIINFIGVYLKHQRLAQNKTQSKIAEAAGVNRMTISQIENGEAISLTSLIQVMRALNILHVLDVFSVREEISPIVLAKLEKQKRQRASKYVPHVSKNQLNEPNQSEW